MAKNDDAKPSTSDEKYYLVPESEWKFGYDPKSERKTRIILTDKKDSTFVRYFDKDSNNGERYFCVGCLNNRRLKNCAELINDKFAAPKFHDCTKISKDICEEEQKELRRKFKEPQRNRASSTSSNDKKSSTKLKAIPKSSKPSTSSSSSPIILGLDSPKKTKSFASMKMAPNTSRSSSPEIVNLTPSPLPHSPSGKAKASTYRRIRTPLDDSSPESTPVKSHQEQVEERKLRLQKRRLLDQKENKNSYAESMNQKAEMDEDEITVLEPEKVSNFEPMDFDDHPESFYSPSFPLHGETPFSTDTEKAGPAKIVNKVIIDEEKPVEKEVVIDKRPKMIPTKKTMLDDDIFRIEPVTAEDGDAILNDDGLQTEHKEAEVTSISENERVNSLSPLASATSRPSVNDDEEAKAKLTPAIINEMNKREWKLGEYEFGVNGRNMREGRITVPDEKKKNYVFEFQKYQGKKWRCCGCSLKNQTKVYGILENGIFYAPPKHLCEPKTRQEWEENQQLIKDKFSNSSELRSGDEYEGVRKTRCCNNRRGSSPTGFSSSHISSRPSTSMSTSDINEFREVDCMYANYGFNENGEMKKRLIVREEDRTLAREYTVIEGEEWKCVNCLIGKAKKNENGNFLVSVKHECAPIPLFNIQEAQNKYGAKNKIPGRSANSLSGNKQRNASQMSSLNSNVQKVDENNTKNFAPSTTQSSSIEASSAQVTSTKASIPVSSSNYIKIPSNQWEWGFDATGHEKMRIIVYVSNDKEHAYEYRNGGRKMFCLGCHALKKYLYATRSDDDIPIISVPPDEEHICAPRTLKEIREQQTTFFKKGKKRPYNEDFSTIAEHGIGKRTRRSVTKIEQDPELSAIVVEGVNGNAFCDDSDTPEPFPSTPNSRAETLEVQPMAEISDANVSLPKFQTYALSNCEFYYPSSGDIKKCCEKLGITFSQAIKVLSHKFWSQIIVTNVGPTSIPNEVYPVSSAERTGYSCFSLFLTGAETNVLEIKKNFLEYYFFKNLEKMGRDCYGKDFSSISDPKTIKIVLADDLTKYHLQAVSDFYECRIGVFVDGKWERYGNWNDETANILTFLMKKEGDKFSPILSLMQ